MESMGLEVKNKKGVKLQAKHYWCWQLVVESGNVSRKRGVGLSQAGIHWNKKCSQGLMEDKLHMLQIIAPSV